MFDTGALILPALLIAVVVAGGVIVVRSGLQASGIPRPLWGLVVAGVFLVLVRWLAAR